MITCKFEHGHEASLRHVVMDGILIKDDKVLLIKRAKNLVHGGKFALPGGFLDRDESVEDGVRREVKEETGYEIDKIQLFNICANPDRGEDRQNVAFIYIVEVGEKRGDPDKEVESMEWYEWNQLPVKENMAFDHHKILELYKKYRNEKFDLPVIS